MTDTPRRVMAARFQYKIVSRLCSPLGTTLPMFFGQRAVSFGVLILFAAGCTQPWPANLPSRTYTGVVTNGPLNIPAAGAEVHANRPTFEHRGLILGLAPDTAENGRAAADAQGRFILRTDTGYATFLTATTSDEHLAGTHELKPDESTSLRIVADQPTFGPTEFGQWVDPNLKTFKVTQQAYLQIVRYVVAHPREAMHSLEDYARRGVISQEALTAFTQHSEYFFGVNPRVKYGWGKDVLVFLTHTRRSRFDGHTQLPCGCMVGCDL